MDLKKQKDMDKDVYSEIIVNLELDLENLTQKTLDVFTHVEKAIGLCIVAYLDIQKLVVQKSFENAENEIFFFKKIKPQVTSKLTFYRRMAKIESLRPVCTIENQIRYLDHEIQKLHDYFNENGDFYTYYKSGQVYSDEFFFTRNKSNLVLSNNNYHYMVDADFSTIHDETVSKLIAYEQLEKYLDNEILKLQRIKTQRDLDPEFGVNKPTNIWNGNNASFIELMYALKEAGVIDNGRTSIKELVELFGKILILPEIDIYGGFQGIKGRKKDRTIFINSLRDALNRKIDESDE